MWKGQAFPNHKVIGKERLKLYNLFDQFKISIPPKYKKSKDPCKAMLKKKDYIDNKDLSKIFKIFDHSDNGDVKGHIPSIFSLLYKVWNHKNYILLDNFMYISLQKLIRKFKIDSEFEIRNYMYHDMLQNYHDLNKWYK